MQQQSFDNFDLSLTLCFSLVKCLTSAVLGDATLLATTAIRYPQPRAPRHAVPLAQPCPVAGWPRPVGTRALFKFVERGLASRSAATVNSVTPGVAMLCHQRVDDAWRALWPLNVTHARAARAAPARLAAARRSCRARLPSGIRQGLSPMPSKSKVDLVGNVRAKREQTYSLFQLSARSCKESKRERHFCFEKSYYR